jgi:hypothetical protein
MTDDEPPLNFKNFPCMGEPETRAQMQKAEPCPRCRSTNITPVSDCDTPPTIAIACNECGEIEGDGAHLQAAVANWNGLPR